MLLQDLDYLTESLCVGSVGNYQVGSYQISDYLACPGLSAREQNLWTKALTGPKRQEARRRSPRKHLKEQRRTIIRRATCSILYKLAMPYKNTV